MSMIISYIGVIVFVGLTAYDTQKLKHMAASQPAGLDGSGPARPGAAAPSPPGSRAGASSRDGRVLGGLMLFAAPTAGGTIATELYDPRAPG